MQSAFLEKLGFKCQGSQSSYVSKAIPEIVSCLSTEIPGLHPCQRRLILLYCVAFFFIVMQLSWDICTL